MVIFKNKINLTNENNIFSYCCIYSDAIFGFL